MCGLLKNLPGRGSLTAILVLALFSLALFVFAGLSSGCTGKRAADIPRHTLSVPDRTGNSLREWPIYRMKTSSESLR
jgi:hypothetical protein